MRLLLRSGAVLCLVVGFLCLASPGPAQSSRDAPPKGGKGKEVPRDTKVNIDLEHILDGGINRNGDLVGIHHYPSAPKELVVEGKKCKVEFYFQNKGGPQEVTTARVQVRDPETKKVLREKFSSLYPAAWSKDQIDRAIREAFAHAAANDGIERDGKWGGTCGAGFRIEGYLSRDRKTITTAFPIYQKR